MLKEIKKKKKNCTSTKHSPAGHWHMNETNFRGIKTLRVWNSSWKVFSPMLKVWLGGNHLNHMWVHYGPCIKIEHASYFKSVPGSRCLRHQFRKTPALHMIRKTHCLICNLSYLFKYTIVDNCNLQKQRNGHIHKRNSQFSFQSGTVVICIYTRCYTLTD